MTTTPAPVRLGIIGSGEIAKSHVACYRSMPGVTVVAIASPTPGHAAALAGEHGVAHAYTDVADMLRRDDIDAVDVCVHNNLHRAATEAALAAGKHVYCEKPLAGSYADALAMHQAAQRAGRMLHVQLATLFSGEVRAARELVEAGGIGTPYHARCTGFRRRGRPFVDGHGNAAFVQKRMAGGGALYDMGVYHLTEMLHVLGNPKVLRISGQVYQQLPMDEARRAQSGYDVEELAVGLVRCAAGLTIDLIEAWALDLDTLEGSSVAGTLGGLRLRPFAHFRSAGHLALDAKADLGLAQFRWERVRGDHPGLSDTHRHWIAALRGAITPLPTAELALNAMLISEGIYLSAARGHEVSADEVRAASRSTALPL